MSDQSRALPDRPSLRYLKLEAKRRFAASDGPEWTSPDEEELRQHFDDRYLSLVPPDWLTRLFGTVAKQLRADLADVQAEPLRLRARLADLRVEAATESDPPYRPALGRPHEPAGPGRTHQRTAGPPARLNRP